LKLEIFMKKFWKTMSVGAAGMAALAAINARIRRNAQEPEDTAFGGDARFFEWQHGRIFYKVAGEEKEGAPLILVHGIGAGASSIRVAERLGEKVEGETELLGKPVLIYGISREKWEDINKTMNDEG